MIAKKDVIQLSKSVSVIFMHLVAKLWWLLPKDGLSMKVSLYFATWFALSLCGLPNGPDGRAYTRKGCGVIGNMHVSVFGVDFVCKSAFYTCVVDL